MFMHVLQPGHSNRKTFTVATLEKNTYSAASRQSVARQWVQAEQQDRLAALKKHIICC
jgi:hypothetical protein